MGRVLGRIIAGDAVQWCYDDEIATRWAALINSAFDRYQCHYAVSELALGPTQPVNWLKNFDNQLRLGVKAEYNQKSLRRLLTTFLTHLVHVIYRKCSKLVFCVIFVCAVPLKSDMTVFAHRSDVAHIILKTCWTEFDVKRWVSWANWAITKQTSQCHRRRQIL